MNLLCSICADFAPRPPKRSLCLIAWLMGGCVLFGGRAVAQPNTGAMQDGAAVILNNDIPRELRDVSVEQKLGDKIPTDLKLIDSVGRKLRMSDLLDGERPLILTLNYSNCPMLCNVQLNQLAQSLQEVKLRIGDDFRLVSVSIDPKETEQRLRETKKLYVQQVPAHPRADEAWSFVRTDKSSINRLASSLGFSYIYNASTGEYSHPAMLAFISPDGIITRYSMGVAFPPDQMRLAIVDAGQGKVGGYIDQFVLWCSDYDPDANSYVPQAWRLMRVGGAGMILLLTLTLVPYWRGRKGASKPGREPANSPIDKDPLIPSRSKPTQLFS